MIHTHTFRTTVGHADVPVWVTIEIEEQGPAYDGGNMCYGADLTAAHMVNFPSVDVSGILTSKAKAAVELLGLMDWKKQEEQLGREYFNEGDIE